MVCRYVCLWLPWTLQKLLNLSRCHLTCESGGVQGTMYYIGSRFSLREEALLKGWRPDSQAAEHAFPVVLASRFPRLLSTSVLIGRPQKQSSVTKLLQWKTLSRCGLSSKTLTTCFTDARDIGLAYNYICILQRHLANVVKEIEPTMRLCRICACSAVLAVIPGKQYLLCGSDVQLLYTIHQNILWNSQCNLMHVTAILLLIVDS